MGYIPLNQTRTQAGAFTVTSAASIYFLDASGGNCTATLPPSTEQSVYTFVRIDDGTGNHDCWVAPAGFDHIDNASSVGLLPGQARTLVSDQDTAWYSLSDAADQNILNELRALTAAIPTADVPDLAQTTSNPPTQAEVQAIATKVDALLAALRTAGIIETP